MTNPKFRQVGHASQRGLIERNGTVVLVLCFWRNLNFQGRASPAVHLGERFSSTTIPDPHIDRDPPFDQSHIVLPRLCSALLWLDSAF